MSGESGFRGVAEQDVKFADTEAQDGAIVYRLWYRFDQRNRVRK